MTTECVLTRVRHNRSATIPACAPAAHLCFTWKIVQVHTGSWQHDLDQARALLGTGAQVHVHGMDSHRLAQALMDGGHLYPIVRDVLLSAIEPCDTAASDSQPGENQLQ
jgi:hypothetical protein